MVAQLSSVKDQKELASDELTRVTMLVRTRLKEDLLGSVLFVGAASRESSKRLSSRSPMSSPLGHDSKSVIRSPSERSLMNSNSIR